MSDRTKKTVVRIFAVLLAVLMVGGSAATLFMYIVYGGF